MRDVNVLTLEDELTQFDGETLQSFQANLQGDLIISADPRYDQVRAIWNGMVDKQPALIARCTSSTDVMAAVNFAREHALLTAVRGGGHNVAGTAMCDGGLVIDLSTMKEIEVEPEARVARAEPGVTWGELDAATQQHGLATPGGVVSMTGIAGLTLNGGIGWLRRKYGLSCDNLLSVELVTASGALITASETENADLFWGIKGGGGNFGVVTSFEYALHPVGPKVAFVFTLYHGDRTVEVLQGYREYCESAPDEVSSFAICGTVPPENTFPEAIHGEPYVLLAACHSGPVDEGMRIMQPLRVIGEPMLDFSEPMPYSEVQKILDEDYPEGELHYYWKSLYLDGLNDDAIAHIAKLSVERPSMLSTVDIWHMDGAIARVAAEDSAVAHRDAPYLLGVESNWEPSEDDEQNIQWTRKAVEEMATYTDRGAYLNFETMEGNDVPAAYGDRYQRLAALKRKYDPNNLFRLNQNITPE